MSASLPKRFSLRLSQSQWRRLLEELTTMERSDTAHGAVPVEKQIERARAGEQLLVYVRCVVEENIAAPADEPLSRDVPLLRATAKYLLTACDRLRRAALRDAWRRWEKIEDDRPPPATPTGSIDEARLWDRTMRELSLQHGVVHPLSEMVTPLPLSEADLSQLGLPCEQLLNGQDLLGM